MNELRDKNYYIVASEHPTRTLCTDWQVRKSLKNAPDGVEYMLFERKRDAEEWKSHVIVPENPWTEHHRKSLKKMEIELLRPEDYLSTNNGKLHPKMLGKMLPYVTELTEMT